MIVIAFQHVAERLRQTQIMRGDDGAGVAPDREFARNAGTADGGDLQRDAGAALHFCRDAVRQCCQTVGLRVHALGDHDDGHGRFQRLAKPVDRPVDTG